MADVKADVLDFIASLWAEARKAAGLDATTGAGAYLYRLRDHAGDLANSDKLPTSRLSRAAGAFSPSRRALWLNRVALGAWLGENQARKDADEILAFYGRNDFGKRIGAFLKTNAELWWQEVARRWPDLPQQSVAVQGFESRIFWFGVRSLAEISAQITADPDAFDGISPTDAMNPEVLLRMTAAQRARLLQQRISPRERRGKSVEWSVPPQDDISVLSCAARAARLHEIAGALGVPLYTNRLLGTPSKDIHVPERLLLRGVPSAGKTVTSFLLFERDDRDLLVIESFAETAGAVQAAGRGLPILFENATRDDARTIMRIAQQLGPIPLVVTTSDEMLTLPGFEPRPVLDATDRLLLDDVLQHFQNHVGVSLSDRDAARIVNNLTEERLETMAGVVHHAARALGHHVPYDPAPLIEQWRTRLPPKETDRWLMLRALAELSAVRGENLFIPRTLIEHYCASHRLNARTLDALHHERWAFVTRSNIVLPEVQREALGAVLWEDDDASISLWLATTDDAGVDQEIHDEWLEHLWPRFRWPTHDYEDGTVAIDRNGYRVRVAGHLARRLLGRHGPLPELVRALAAASHLDVLLPLPDDALSQVWMRILFAARDAESFGTFFERAFCDDHDVITHEARAAIACAIEEKNARVAHVALDVVRRLGTTADIKEWTEFIECELGSAVSPSGAVDPHS